MSRHAQNVLLQDADLTVESWEVPHIASIAPWLRADAEWKRWDGPYFAGPSEDARGALVNQMYADPWQRDAISDWPMRLPLCRDGVAIGSLSWHWEDTTSGWIRVGIVIYDPDHWGAGIGTRALALWVRWLTTLPDAHRIDLATWSGNERMIRSARSIGMTDDARMKSARLVDGARYDSVVLGLVIGERLVSPPGLDTV